MTKNAQKRWYDMEKLDERRIEKKIQPMCSKENRHIKKDIICYS